MLSTTRVALALSLALLLISAAGSRPIAAPIAESASAPRPVAATVVSGESHSCAITDTGGLKCWGRNDCGQLGDGTMLPSGEPVDVVGLSSGVVAVAAGMAHTCAVTAAGVVKCWGSNLYGQLGYTPVVPWRLTPVEVSGLGVPVAALAAGATHTCALTNAGAVKCWGDNSYGKLGDGTTFSRFAPADVVGLTAGVAEVAAGGQHTCAVTSGGAVKCWGFNSSGQLGDGTTEWVRLTPVDVSGLAGPAVSVATGASHSCAVTSAGTAQCWGFNGSGQLGDGTTTLRTTPATVSGLASGATSVTAYGAHTCAVTSAGGVECWGDNSSGQLGDGTTTSRTAPISVIGMPTTVAAATASDHTCALTAAGAVRCWGDNAYGQAGDGPLPFSPRDVTRAASGATGLAMGAETSCAVTAEGGTKCWGTNATGVLTNGARWTSSTVAIDVDATSHPVKQVAIGLHHACVLTDEGGVECWGDNTSGQLGDGTTAPNRLAAVPVSGLASGVVAIAAGDCHTCALTGAGAVKCWGCNAVGQLGNGTQTECRTPAGVTGLSNGVVALAASGGAEVPFQNLNHTCALTAAGGVKCWGYNSHGQLGDGTRTNRLVPVDAVGLEGGVLSIGAGIGHTCAATNTSVKCWGDNFWGQLGDGTTVYQTIPVDVVGLSGGITAFAAGLDHTCALTDAGAVKCWGGNSWHQLGDSTTTARSTPGDVPGLESSITAIASGSYHSCALTTDGGVKCWGRDSAGQLGSGRWLSRTRPYRVTGLGPATSAGDFTGDGRADYAVFRASSGEWLVRGEAGSVFLGAPGDVSVAGDYDGDSITEVATFRPGNATWTLKDVALEWSAPFDVCGTDGISTCDQGQAALGVVQFGAPGDVPVPADYDGDGWTDIAVWRPSDGRWIVRGQVSVINWGLGGGVPVPADYDGDGRADFAIFRPWTGDWLVRDIGTWTLGEPGDIPVPADYDGDSVTDVAVFRPSSGTWHVLGQGSWQLGAEGDVPLPLDLDADGRSEFVVFRPSGSTWHSLAPYTGATSDVAFGVQGDAAALARPAVPPEALRSEPHDFNGDWTRDIFRYHPETGAWAIRYMPSIAKEATGSWSPGWKIAEGDFNSDHHADLFVYDPVQGWWYVCLNDRAGGFKYHGGRWSRGWTMEVLDLDGDSVSDVFVYNRENGLWFQCLTRGAGVFEYHGGRWSPGWSLYKADFDGNAAEDLFVYDPVNGFWYECVSDAAGSFTYAGGRWSPGWNVSVFDWTGDNRSDVFVYNEANGLRYSCANTGAGQFDCGTPASWSPGWKVGSGDFDGDGSGDIFVYDPVTGVWFVCVMADDGEFTYYRGEWSPGWEFLIADVAGDSRSDVVVYNPSNGDFFVCTTIHVGAFSHEYRNLGPGWEVFVR